MQSVAGVRARAEAAGSRFIREQMPLQHQEFFGLLPWLLIAGVDPSGQPQASLLTGAPGFVQAPDARRLVISAAPLPGDPLPACLYAGADVGLLGLQPGTRRRNRANGRVVAHDGTATTVEVQQSFGNCPQYIQPLELRHEAGVRPSGVGYTSTRLEGAAAAIVAGADTFFLASARPREAGFDVDMSHRGGPAGFVSSADGGSLSFPDFAGNNFFNSLGNLHVHPPAGLLFVDRGSGARVHVAGDAEIVWANADERSVRIRVREVRCLSGPLPLRWG